MAISGDILTALASQTTLASVQTTIGTTTDSGGSSTEGSLMAKLNEILEQLGISTTGSTVQEVLEELLTQPNIIKHSQISTVYTNDIATIGLTGFSNIEKMICIPAGLYIETFTQTSVKVISVGSQNYTYKTVQVIEFY